MPLVGISEPLLVFIKIFVIMRNIKPCCLFLIIACFYQQSKAQTNIFTDSLAKNYDRNTILLQNGYFERNGEQIPYGIFKRNLKHQMNLYIMSGREFKRYENKKWLSFATSVVGLTVMLTSIKDRKINWTQYSIGNGLILLAIPFSSQSNNHYNRAIWFYNREAILRGQ